MLFAVKICLTSEAEIQNRRRYSKKYFFSKSFRYRKNVRTAPGCPDIVLSKYWTVIFVNGCFWHEHDCPRSVRPSSNEVYWIPKI
ncbi:hypothetical protein [Faecalibacterium prausnitzii]|uniref:hypothetical protein n=1 Tax=Faecalibacterium prausnitzii TaxID=853 RepID=UPI0029666769|nr:hypothetical protein [Faecalibacterium prausnitzii]MDW2997377.1 hypothetical protein [Faecalibacterium prausnitzii]